MVNNHRHSYGESIKKPPRALLLNSIQTTNYALNVRFRSIAPQTPFTDQRQKIIELRQCQRIQRDCIIFLCNQNIALGYYQVF
mgnify:CR=1 FL=1